MATVNEPCPSCGAPTDVYIGQRISFDDKLLWSRAIQCQTCGHTMEADDSGFLPESYRAAVLAQDGAWSVAVSDANVRNRVALVLVDALGIGRVEALRIAKAIPGPIWSGSQAEAEWLRRQL